MYKSLLLLSYKHKIVKVKYIELKYKSALKMRRYNMFELLAPALSNMLFMYLCLPHTHTHFHLIVKRLKSVWYNPFSQITSVGT